LPRQIKKHKLGQNKNQTKNYNQPIKIVVFYKFNNTPLQQLFNKNKKKVHFAKQKRSSEYAIIT